MPPGKGRRSPLAEMVASFAAVRRRETRWEGRPFPRFAPRVRRASCIGGKSSGSSTVVFCESRKGLRSAMRVIYLKYIVLIPSYRYHIEKVSSFSLFFSCFLVWSALESRALRIKHQSRRVIYLFLRIILFLFLFLVRIKLNSAEKEIVNYDGTVAQRLGMVDMNYLCSIIG